MHVTDIVFRRVSTPEASTVSCVSVSLWCAEERISHSHSQLSESCTSWALGTSQCFNCWRLAHELRAEILMQWRNKSNITRWLERWRNPQGAEFSFDAGGIYTDTERRVKLVKNNEESSLRAKKNKNKKKTDSGMVRLYFMFHCVHQAVISDIILLKCNISVEHQLIQYLIL